MCIYCKDHFGNKGIEIKPKWNWRRLGLYHKRIDGRLLKCSGKRDQNLVESCLDNAYAIHDSFDKILIMGVKNAPPHYKQPGIWIASSENLTMSEMKRMLEVVSIPMPPIKDQRPTSPLLDPETWSSTEELKHLDS